MIRRGYVDTPFGQIHYRTAGARGAPPLVLFHQTASSSAMFEPLLARLGDRFHCFAPDTPGFGGSDPLSSPATMPEYAQVLHAACLAFGFERAIVFGHHTGASIAVQVEHDRPGFTQAMILSGPPYLDEARRRALARGVEPMQFDEAGGHVAATWRRLRAKNDRAPLSLTHRETVLTLQAGPRWHEAYLAVADHDLPAQLAHVRCPVVVLVGEKDTLADVAEKAARAVGTTVQWIADADTYVCDLHADAVAAVIRDAAAGVAVR